MAKSGTLSFRISDPDGVLDAIATLEHIRDDAEHRIAALRSQLAVERRVSRSDPLLDPLSDEWRNLERAIWPDGPASGRGSGAFAAFRDQIIARLRDC